MDHYDEGWNIFNLVADASAPCEAENKRPPSHLTILRHLIFCYLTSPFSLNKLQFAWQGALDEPGQIVCFLQPAQHLLSSVEPVCRSKVRNKIPK